ncbi:MAG: flagellar biosynthetic protein FliO [Anaerohalosphaeraceae bacterium]
MAKKRLICLGLLLVLSIVGQVVLRPALGEAKALPENTAQQSVVDQWNLKDDTTGSGFGGGKLMGQFLVMLLFVALIGIAAWFLLKKMNNPWLRGKGGHLSVIETLPLGARRSIHLIQAGNKQLLISNSPEGVRLLTDMTGAIASLPQEDQ